MVDATQREAALGALVGLCDLPLLSPATDNKLVYFIHLAGVHSALYTVQTAEIQLRDLALEYLLKLAGILAAELKSSSGSKVAERITKRLIVNALWPGKHRRQR